MCVTSGPAKLGKTKVAAWEITAGEHALGYQNQPQSLVGGSDGKNIERFIPRGIDQEGQPTFDWDSEGYNLTTLSTANCMLLPIPLSKDAKVMDIALVDTRSIKNCLTDMAEAIRQPAAMTRGGAKGIETFGGPRGEVHRFEFDVYSIVLAEFAGDAYNALETVAPSRRPSIKEELLMAYEEWYGWPLALCCFDNVEAKDAAPLIFTYQTRFPGKLFLPAIHGHDGNVPDLYSKVEDDHTYIGGSCLSKRGEIVNYRDKIEGVADQILPTRVVGATADYYHTQGDVVLDVQKVRQGIFELNRLLPPNAPRPRKMAAQKSTGRTTNSSFW